VAGVEGAGPFDPPTHRRAGPAAAAAAGPVRRRGDRGHLPPSFQLVPVYLDSCEVCAARAWTATLRKSRPRNGRTDCGTRRQTRTPKNRDPPGGVRIAIVIIIILFAQ